MHEPRAPPVQREPAYSLLLVRQQAQWHTGLAQEVIQPEHASRKYQHSDAEATLAAGCIGWHSKHKPRCCCGCALLVLVAGEPAGSDVAVAVFASAAAECPFLARGPS
eukprot:9942-Heterococcus_DN1.PRE.1